MAFEVTLTKLSLNHMHLLPDVRIAKYFYKRCTHASFYQQYICKSFKYNRVEQVSINGIFARFSNMIEFRQ